MQGIDVIILIIVAVLLLIALYGSIRHFKGEGPCCGGTSSRKSQEKQLMRPVIGRKILRISGMHCENCADHVARRPQCDRRRVRKCQLERRQGHGQL